MPRGRLIFPFLVDVARYDSAAVEADPDAGGPLTSGYDDDFREPVQVPPVSGSARVAPVRVETVVQLLAQVEPEEQERLQMGVTGRMAGNRMTLIFHYRDLEAAGMVDSASGRPKLRGPADRLAAIRNHRTGALIEQLPENPGFYASEVRSLGFGLGPHRNLLLVLFEQRDRSALSG